jgi:hypothetical protein
MLLKRLIGNGESAKIATTVLKINTIFQIRAELENKSNFPLLLAPGGPQTKVPVGR